ncbi:glycosyltransferase [Serratia sp. AKBS12]|uniref:glycosyltransferase n=1 Tax=Serratia sp. AKBS12 TaxID=2974597 RepID=UPI002165A63D|nr:glycosyltransferase [Serratia sp. AKBS12]MCS3409370.1 glycosyltransferase [Serratia sp. AKBS12]HEI8865685.1 glycosyltransferase [Serratia odorifera]
MKVLHAAETIKGGVATVMRQIILANVADPEIKDVHCLIPRDQKDEVKVLPQETVLTFKRSGRNPISFLSFVFKFISTLVQYKPDLIHLHSTFAGVLGRLVLILCYPIYRPKVIYCPHAFSFLMEGGNAKRLVYKIIEKGLLPITDAVICVSEFERKAAIEHGLNAKKLKVVYNGVPIASDTDVYPNPFRQDVINLLFVGRFDYQKGFDILSKMVNDLAGKPYHLTIIGGAVHSDELQYELPQTTFTGWLSSDQIAPYFFHADVLIIPSRWEGFAMVPLEAMSYGTPIISSNCTSFPEMITPGVNGYMFDITSPSELPKIIEGKSKEDWRLLGINAKAIFLNKFKADKMIAETIKIYKESFI